MRIFSSSLILFFLLALNINSAVAQTINTSAVSSPICTNNIINVPYTITGSFIAGNVFTAQLSDATGSFATPTVIGTLGSTVAGTIDALVPPSVATGTAYRIRVVSTNPAITGTINPSDLAINISVNPYLTIAVTTGSITGCTNSSIILNATQINGGGSPTYQWKVNGTNVGTGISYTNNAWANGDVIACKMNSTATCPLPISVNSNEIVINIDNPTANTWQQKADIGLSKANGGPSPRYAATGFSIGNKGYIGTGVSGTYYKDFWEYDPATNIWTQKADFGGVARWQATGFSIGNKGYIGTGEGASVYNDFWEYDPAANLWTQKANFGGSARYSAAGFSIGSKGYIGTGNDGATKNDFWEYDPATNNWTQKANFGGIARGAAVGFSIGSRGYIGTGYEGTPFDGSYKNDFWEYDPAANTWGPKANFGGTARQFATGFNIGTKGYIGTGSDGSVKRDFWEYDPSSNLWTQKANYAGNSRQWANGVSIGNKGYIGLGYDGGSYKNDLWEYDPLANNWMQKTCGVRNAAVGFNIGSKGYIGTGGSGIRNDFWEYDPISNTWTQKANFGGTARVGAVGFSIGSKGYIGTGNDGTYKNDFWEYDPIANTWTQKTNFGGVGRYNAVGFSIGSKGYIGTGYNGSFIGDFWEYDQATNTWTLKANFGGTAREAATGFSINTKGYIGTGYGPGITNDFWEYDPVSNNWTAKTNFGGGARGGAVGLSIGNKGYIGTGGGGANPTYQDFWEYDPVGNNWTQKANFGGALTTNAAAFSIGSKGYIGSGNNAGTDYKNDFWEYSPTNTRITTGSISSSFCPGVTISIPFTIGCYSFTAGNIFTAQLSDVYGTFSNPVNIGTLTATGSGTISATIPLATIAGSRYRIRVIGNNPSTFGLDNGSDISIIKPVPAFTVNNSTQCHGGNNFAFTNTSTILSGTMTYQWNFGDNTTSTSVSPSHIYLTQGNYTVKLVATSSVGCKDSVTTNVTVSNCGSYTFIGNGDWLTPSNWLNNLVPPATIPTNMDVTISPSPGGQCFYIGTITLQGDGIIIVSPGTGFNVRVQ